MLFFLLFFFLVSEIWLKWPQYSWIEIEEYLLCTLSPLITISPFRLWPRCIIRAFVTDSLKLLILWSTCFWIRCITISQDVDITVDNFFTLKLQHTSNTLQRYLCLVPSFSPGWEAPTSSLKPTGVGRKQEHEGQLWTQWNQKAGKLELMELENIVANTVYLKAREGELSEQPLQVSSTFTQLRFNS